jgi:O-succinylbenzoate synthase
VTRIRSIELHLIAIPLVRPFRTSFGESTEKVCILARVETDDAVGWGECVSDVEPSFSEEWNEGAWLMIRDLLAPALFAAGDLEAELVASVLSFVRGHPMAKATLVNAVLDAELRAQGRSLASYLGAVRDRVECGVSVGIAPSTDVLLEQVAGYLAEGYRRIKLKIEPGTDVERVGAVREANPEILLSVDANAAYRLADIAVFKQLDAFGLLMIEQPLHHEDVWEHSLLQREIRTDICLDESIRSAADARAAIELGGVPDREHQAGARRRVARGQARARRRIRARRAGVVRGDARDRGRAFDEPGVGRPPELPTSGGHQRDVPVLRR